MADYPNSIYEPRTRENKSGVIYDPTKKTVLFNEDISLLEDEVIALETFSKQSTLEPESPVAGSSWFDPVTFTLYIYTGTDGKSVSLT